MKRPFDWYGAILILVAGFVLIVGYSANAQQKKHTPPRVSLSAKEAESVSKSITRLQKAQVAAQTAFERAEEIKALAQKELEAATLENQLAAEKIAHAHEIDNIEEYDITQGAKPGDIDLILKGTAPDKTAAAPAKKDDKQE